MSIYLKYLLITLAVILLSSLLAYFMMKKAKKAERKNIVYLASCTVLAMICAALTPPLANLLAQALYFSLILSILVSVALLFLLSAVLFIGLHRKMEQASGEEPHADKKTQIISPELKENPEQSGVGDAGENMCQEDELAADDAKELDIPFEEAAPALVQEETDLDESIVKRLLTQAQESKNSHHYLDAILAYEAVLSQSPRDGELFLWVMVDLCSLYKMTHQTPLIYKTLEEYKNLLDMEVRENILRNL